MTTVGVLAGKASPGATTVAVALSLSWPGPVLLVDADPAGGDVAPGLLPGRADTDTGLLSWVVATRHLPALEATGVLAEHALALPEAGDAWVLPGLQSASQVEALAGGGWTRLATAVERCASVLGRDVVVDVGRVGQASGWPVIGACDVVVLVVRPTARSVQGATAAAALLRARLGDLDAVRLLVNGAGPYPPAQVAEQLGLARPVVVPADRRGAAALVDGSVATVRGLTRSRLLRATSVLADRMTGSPRSQVVV